MLLKEDATVKLTTKLKSFECLVPYRDSLINVARICLKMIIILQYFFSVFLFSITKQPMKKLTQWHRITLVMASLTLVCSWIELTKFDIPNIWIYITKFELVFRDKLRYGARRKLVYLSRSDENSNLTKIQNYENFVRGRNESPENSKIRSSRPKIMSSTPHFNPHS